MTAFFDGGGGGNESDGSAAKFDVRGVTALAARLK